MKNLITILILFAFGCGKSEVENSKELTKEDVLGSYEAELVEDTYKLVFLEGGTVETYKNGEKFSGGTWKISGKEVHYIFE